MNEPRYAPSPDVMVAEIGGEAVLLHAVSKRYYRLNETGAAVWSGIEQGLESSAIVDFICDTFDVRPSDAAAEVQRLLRDLAAHQLIHEPGDKSGEELERRRP
jgi:hypothetical protein